MPPFLAKCWRRNCSPGDDDEHIEAVPRLGEVGWPSDESHRQHLDAHFGSEEDEDGVVETLEDAAADCDAGCRVWARLVHAERDAVQEDDCHADTLEPSGLEGVKDSQLLYETLFEPYLFIYLFIISTSYKK